MKISNICSWICGGLLLSLIPNPAMGFTLDFFSETETNFYDLKQNGTVLIPNFDSQDAQEVRIDDDLTSSNYTGVFYPSEDTDTNLNGVNGVEGENRHIKIEATDLTNTSTLKVDNGIVNLSTPSSTTTTGTIVWNGSNSIDYNDFTTDANLSLDLEKDGDGDDSIAFEIKFADLGGTLELTLYDGTNTYPYSQSIPIVGTSDDPASVYYDFGTYESNGIDINNIEYISAEITGPAASDIEIDFLETAVKPVPFEFSPSLGIIMSGAFVGINILKKKLKTA